ncbi:hypothetical protein [Mycobacterium interjectum]|uniref:hypothetical protein n=1 Tax=Mycobacterium interjectum TaxID=33895 RepID=UPI0011559407|nr:hypothetical protein [Mycobacterium interjectum]MCV7092034.1 hypothetical protein [Mycobacterium interjectum]
MATLLSTARRERVKDRNSREDDYRKDARASVSAVLTAAAEFERHGRVLSEQWRWIRMGYTRATQLADATELAMKDLQQKVIAASVLVAEIELQSSLHNFRTAFDHAASVIHDAVDSFWEGMPAKKSSAVREDAWTQYGECCGAMVAVTSQLLSPTVRSSDC